MRVISPTPVPLAPASPLSWLASIRSDVSSDSRLHIPHSLASPIGDTVRVSQSVALINTCRDWLQYDGSNVLEIIGGHAPASACTVQHHSGALCCNLTIAIYFRWVVTCIDMQTFPHVRNHESRCYSHE